MRTVIIRDLLENLFDCYSPAEHGAFSSETSLFLLAGAGGTRVVDLSSVDLSTSFPGLSPTRPTEREIVGENPGNEVIDRFVCTLTASSRIQIFFYRSDIKSCRAELLKFQ